MSKCQEVMCKFNLYEKEDAIRWTLGNSPDKINHRYKDPNITPEIYAKNIELIRACSSTNKFCPPPAPPASSLLPTSSTPSRDRPSGWSKTPRTSVISPYMPA